MTRIYTRTGDTGQTGLFGGERVLKCDLRVEAYGAVDELNASIGAARTSAMPNDIDEILMRVQHDLFSMGSDLATPGSEAQKAGGIRINRIQSSLATRLEGEIDRFGAQLEPLRQFILPGGSLAAAALHVSRTICRRAERRCVELSNNLAAGDFINAEVITYLNRLSDLLFVLARSANMQCGTADIAWNPEV